MTTALRATEAEFDAFFGEQLRQLRRTAAQAQVRNLRSGIRRRIARAH
jgi:hypothetical protein